MADDNNWGAALSSGGMPQGGGAPAPMPQPPQQSGMQQQVQQAQTQAANPPTHLRTPTINAQNAGGGMKGNLLGLIPVVGGALQQSLQQKKKAEVDKYVAIFRQLDGEWVNAQQMAGGDSNKANEIFKNSPTYQTIFNAHDPKAFKIQKELHKVFTDPWDATGDTSPATEGFKRHSQLKTAEQKVDSMQRMKTAFDQIRQSMPKNQADPKQVSELAEADARLQQAARDRMQLTTDNKGNLISVNKDTNTAQPVKVDYGDGKGLQTAQAQPKGGQFKPAVLFGAGRLPIGITKMGPDGKAMIAQPGDVAFTPDDAKLFKSAQDAYSVNQQYMNSRIVMGARARADAFGNTKLYGAEDADGNLTFVTPNMVRANPNGYAPAAQAVQAQIRSTVFKELDTTMNLMDQVIARMPDTPLPIGVQAKLAVAMQDEDPRSAVDSVIGSLAKGTLNEDQVAYATTGASMAESAMMLRLAGAGGTSDMLRMAVQKMVPAAGTPSKSYAQNQMRLLHTQLKVLRKSVPGTPNDHGDGSGPSLDDALDNVFGKSKK